MDRQIVFPGAIPLETDLLNTNKFAMLGLAKLAATLMGSNTYVHGLACTASSPASMVVNIAPGQIYSLKNIDATAYSSLPADTTHSILKQGVILDATQFTLTAPVTSGFSINYLIQATYTDTDSGATVLPYYNASNPSVAWSGPNNSGAAQNTTRSGVCTVSLKSGVAASTGTQVTPTPDTGYVGLYVVTVVQGATTITASNITTYANAPIIPQAGIVDAIQRNSIRYAADSGSANAYIVNISPGIQSLSDGMEINFKATTANTAASTLNVCALGAFPVVNKFGAALISGEIAAGGHVTVKWSSATSSWFILDSTSAIPTIPTAAAGTKNTQAASTAFVASMSNGRLLSTQIFTSSGTYTPTTGTSFVIVECLGGGGGGGGCAANGSGQASGGQGGGAGAYGVGYFTTGFSGATMSIGTAGTAGASGVNDGGPGGTTSFGSLLSVSGGLGGKSGQAVTLVAIGQTPTANTATITGANLYSMPGDDGWSSILAKTVAPANLSGRGASSKYGKGGSAISAQGDGSAAIGRGAGGSGGISYASAAAQAGGAGAAGMIVIWEYA